MRGSRWPCNVHLSTRQVESFGVSIQGRLKTDFQDGRHDSQRFPFSIILAFFYLQVIMILPTKFPVDWPFG